MGVIERASPTGVAPDTLVRTALRRAIADRKAAKARHHHLEEAERLGCDLCSASEQVFLAFQDVDARMVQHRAEELKCLATGVQVPDFSVPDELIARRTMRDEAQKQVIAAKATHESLVAELSEAKSVVLQAGRNIAVAAIDVLMSEGAKQAAALKAAWNDVWRHCDQLSALADCRLHYADASFPITLPSEIVTVLQTIGVVDRREFADGHNDRAAHAGEVWCDWFESLLTDAEVEVTFDGSDPEVGNEDRPMTSLVPHGSI